MVYARIVGTGSYLPEEVITNQDIAKMVDTSHEWIVERTGIHERHRAAPDQSTVDVAYQAATQAMESANINAGDIDLIIGTTGTPDYFFPSMACELQSRLGANCRSMDVQAACSGFVYALEVANLYIKSGLAKTVLIASAELMSRLVDWSDRRTCVLFGDGAGSAVLQASDEPGILSTHTYADGNMGHLLSVRNPQLEYYNQEGYGPGAIFMDGQKVFKNAVTRLEALVQEVIEHNDISESDVDWLIPHQANGRIIEATAHKLKMSMERVVFTLPQQGNTSSASIPLALDAAVRDGRIKRGQNLLLEAFGAGLTWGAALIKF